MLKYFMATKSITVYSLFWNTVKKFGWQYFFIFLAAIISLSFNSLVPLIYQRFINIISVGEIIKGAPELTKLIVFLCLIYLGRIIFRTVSGGIESITTPRAIGSLTSTLYQATEKHSYRFFTNNFSGSLVKKIQRTANSYTVIMSILLYSVLQLLAATTIAVILIGGKSPLLAGVFLLWVGIIFVYNLLHSKSLHLIRKKRTALDSKATGALSDAIINSNNIKLFNGSTHEINLFDKILNDLAIARTKVWWAQFMSWRSQDIFVIAIETVTLFYLVSGWKQGRFTVGDFAMIQIIIVQLSSAIMNIGQVLRDWLEATSDAEEMTDILNTPYEVRDAPDAKNISANNGEIIFDKVGFNYNETRTVLKDFLLKIKPHEKIALVGSSGAGKSTVVKLLFRFFDVTEGKILIDGQDIAKATQESLHNILSLVPQDPMLFHRSLMENIRYGKFNATDKEVMEAAKKAHCHEFIVSLPDGYNTFVGERGVKLSGGERQRVAIARAILRNAPILVLDEATSSLDSESEMLIQQALAELMREKTVIVIAHRLSTIAKMDRIIVMENGQMIDEGTHASLLKKRGGVYKKFWQIQAGGFVA